MITTGATPRVYEKKTNTNTHTKNNETTAAKKYRQIKLGVDVHADSYRVVRQIDGATPPPAQKFTPAGFLIFAAKQLAEAEEVHSCYEAGPFGYGLHRQLVQRKRSRDRHSDQQSFLRKPNL